MSTLSILVGVIVILMLAGTAYLFRPESGDDDKIAEQSMQNNHRIETENKAVESNNTVSDVEITQAQRVKFTPVAAEGDSLQMVETIEAISEYQSKPIEATATTTTVLEEDKKEQPSEKEVETPSTGKVSNADEVAVVENTVREVTESEIVTRDTNDQKLAVNKTEDEVAEVKKKQAPDTTKVPTIDNSADEVVESETEENKSKKEVSHSETMGSAQPDSIKTAIQQQIKKSKEVLKLLIDHEEQ